MKNIHYVVELTGQICSMTLSLEYDTCSPVFRLFQQSHGLWSSCPAPYQARVRGIIISGWVRSVLFYAQKEIQFPFVPEII